MSTLWDLVLLAKSRDSRVLPSLFLLLGAALIASFLLFRVLESRPKKTLRILRSPSSTLSSSTAAEDVVRLPYPPNALPGARDIPSQYGTCRVYEWGPDGGERVLLIHGISTPSIALADLAHKLVQRGCRVMLFVANFGLLYTFLVLGFCCASIVSTGELKLADLYGRGYSSGPDPRSRLYDAALYTYQIRRCLATSLVAWIHFTIIGYSLGGALAVDFAAHFPEAIQNLVLVAPGGLIRTEHISWKSQLLYHWSDFLPTSLVHAFVARRLWSGPDNTRKIEPEQSQAGNSAGASSKGAVTRNAVYTSSRHRLLPDNPHSTVAETVNWQIENHEGFIPAFISTIRWAPIHDQHERWEVIRKNIEEKKGPLQHVWLVLGEKDPIVIADELIEDAKSILGEGSVRAKVVQGAGHEVAVQHADIIDEVMKAILKHII